MWNLAFWSLKTYHHNYNAYGYQTCQSNDILWEASTHKVTWTFDHVTLWYNVTLYKKSFPLRISSLNVTKSTGNCEFGRVYWKKPKWKTSFSVASEKLKTLSLYYRNTYGHQTWKNRNLSSICHTYHHQRLQDGDLLIN